MGASRGYTGLAVGKGASAKIDVHAIEGLALALVDGDGPGGLQGLLDEGSLHLACNLASGRIKAVLYALSLFGTPGRHTHAVPCSGCRILPLPLCLSRPCGLLHGLPVLLAVLLRILLRAPAHILSLP